GRRHTIFSRDWSSDVCSSDLEIGERALRATLGLENPLQVFLVPPPRRVGRHTPAGEPRARERELGLAVDVGLATIEIGHEVFAQRPHEVVVLLPPRGRFVDRVDDRDGVLDLTLPLLLGERGLLFERALAPPLAAAEQPGREQLATCDADRYPRHRAPPSSCFRYSTSAGSS